MFLKYIFYSSASAVSLDFHEIPSVTHGAEEVFCKWQVVNSLEWNNGLGGSQAAFFLAPP